MAKKFKQSVIEALGYYVYALVDPRDNRIFYIGKGCGDRVFQHAEDALIEDNESLKLSTIRDIRNKGLDVAYYILRHNLTEKEAYLVESSLIDLLTYHDFNKKSILSNVASGHHQWDEGIKTVNEINTLYNCAKIDPINGDRLLLVSLNKSYKQSKAEGVYVRANDYESARKYWAVSKDKVGKIDYILGVYKGIVRIVIKVNGYTPCNSAEDGTKFKSTRYAFEGDIIPDSPYLNTDVTDYPFGSGGEKTYIPRDTKAWTSQVLITGNVKCASCGKPINGVLNFNFHGCIGKDNKIYQAHYCDSCIEKGVICNNCGRKVTKIINRDIIF